MSKKLMQYPFRTLLKMYFDTYQEKSCFTLNVKCITISAGLVMRKTPKDQLDHLVASIRIE